MALVALERYGTSPLVEVTLSLDTGGAYADGDVLAEFQEVTGFVRHKKGTATIHSITVLDQDDQGVAMDILFAKASSTLGTENSAVSITDADAANIVGGVSIAAANYIDLIASQVAFKTGLNIVYQADDDSQSLWVGAISRGGTPTHTASGIILKIGVIQN